MKKGFGRASTARMAGTCVLLIATMVSPEALAQGGRATQGRGDTTSRVERKDAASNQARAAERPASRNSKAVQRSQERTGATAQRRDGSKSPTAANDGRNGRSVQQNAGRVQDRGKSTAQRREEGKSPTVANDGRSGRSVQRDAPRSQPATQNRTVERKGDTRQVTRGQEGSVAARTSTRVERDGRDRDGRTLNSGRDRDNRTGYREGQRSRYVGAQYDRGKSVRDLYMYRDHHYYHRRFHRSEYAWCTTYHHPGHFHYVDAHIHIGSHLYIGVTWPWELRYRSHWRPRFRYRQVVYVDAGWAGRRLRNRVEVQTYYRHRVLFANDLYSEVEIEIDAIDLYQNGRFLSTVDRIPGNLKKVRAVIHADGRIEFDRNLFLMGDAGNGFEIISTRYYADNLFDAYNRDHGYQVGRVNLSRGTVKKVRWSRYFDHGRFAGYAPISLLPDDDRLWDYGRPVSYRDDYRAPDEGWYRSYRGVNPQPYDGEYELSRDFRDTYSVGDGGDVRLERATALDRLD